MASSLALILLFFLRQQTWQQPLETTHTLGRVQHNFSHMVSYGLRPRYDALILCHPYSARLFMEPTHHMNFSNLATGGDPDRCEDSRCSEQEKGCNLLTTMSSSRATLSSSMMVSFSSLSIYHLSNGVNSDILAA